MPIRILFLLLFLAPAIAARGQLKAIPPRPGGSDSLSLFRRSVHPEMRPAMIKYNYYRELGAACKVEWKLEQATRVPFRFRLGALQQTEYLEQKPNAIKP